MSGCKGDFLHIKHIYFENNLIALIGDFINIVPCRLASEQGYSYKPLNASGRVAEAVNKLINNIRCVVVRLDIRNPAVNLKPLRNAVDIILGNVGVNGQIDCTFLFGSGGCFALFFAYRLFKQFYIHFIADRFHVAVLIRAENIARSSQFKVTHGNMKA